MASKEATSLAEFENGAKAIYRAYLYPVDGDKLPTREQYQAAKDVLKARGILSKPEGSAITFGKVSLHFGKPGKKEQPEDAADDDAKAEVA